MTPDLPDDISAPGSWDAIWKGCTCPRIDNHYGHGRPSSDGKPHFVITIGCPVHNPKTLATALAAVAALEMEGE